MCVIGYSIFGTDSMILGIVPCRGEQALRISKGSLKRQNDHPPFEAGFKKAYHTAFWGIFFACFRVEFFITILYMQRILVGKFCQDIDGEGNRYNFIVSIRCHVAPGIKWSFHESSVFTGILETNPLF